MGIIFSKCRRHATADTGDIVRQSFRASNRAARNPGNNEVSTSSQGENRAARNPGNNEVSTTPQGENRAARNPGNNEVSTTPQGANRTARNPGNNEVSTSSQGENRAARNPGNNEVSTTPQGENRAARNPGNNEVSTTPQGENRAARNPGNNEVSTTPQGASGNNNNRKEETVLPGPSGLGNKPQSTQYPDESIGSDNYGLSGISDADEGGSPFDIGCDESNTSVKHDAPVIEYNRRFAIETQSDTSDDAISEAEPEDRSVGEEDDVSSVDSQPVPITGSLTEANLVQFSERVVKDVELRNLGVRGLELPGYKIEAALTNHPGNIQAAAFDVLRIWYRSQPDAETACQKLNEALQKCGSKGLTQELAQIVQGPREKVKLSAERLEKLRRLNKQSLLEKPFSTAKGNIWTDTPRSIDMDKIYTKLQWVKRSTETYGSVKTALDDVTQLFDVNQVGQSGPVRILVEGPGGIGKSTAMKHLAMTWAKGSLDHLFDFVFHLELKAVQKNLSIEDLIVKQHKAFKGNKAHPNEIRAVLDEQSDQRVLVILDGHDEYKRGNRHIDKALRKDHLRNCWVVVTSRVTKELVALRDYMDAEAEITGFDGNSVTEYCTKYLGSKEKCEELLDVAKDKEITQRDGNDIDYGILSIPILLHMICCLFLRKVSLPKLKTGILSAIVDRCVDWETIRTTGKKKIQAVEKAIVNLGKLAMDGLLRKDLQQAFDKSEVFSKVGPKALELGLLMGTESDPTEEEQTQVYSFHHLLIQQFVAAKYVATLKKVKLHRLFRTWHSIMTHQDVIRFACGLTGSTQSILDFVYNTLVDHCMQTPDDCSSFLLNECAPFLRSLCEEVSEHVAIDPLNNKYINFVADQNSPVFLPSKYFVFNLRHGYKSGTIRNQRDDRLLGSAKSFSGNCEIINYVSFQETSKAMQEISHGQRLSVRKLHLSDIKFTENNKVLLNYLKMCRDARRVAISNCEFPGEIWNHIAAQLKECTGTFMQYVSMTGCQMNPSVSMSVLSGLSHCTRLVALNLSDNILTNYLCHLFGKPGADGYLHLKELRMERAKLNDKDIDNLIKSLHGRQLPKMEVLCLNENNLRRKIRELFNTRNMQLQHLDISKCNITPNDVRALFEAIKYGMLPNLKVLNFLPAVLTGCLGLILSTVDLECAIYPFKINFDMTDTVLNEDDVKTLVEVGSKRPLANNLRYLYLPTLKLTDNLPALLRNTGRKLKHLNLRECQLNEDDVKGLTQASRDGHLSYLERLDLSYNRLTGNVKALFTAIGGGMTYLKLLYCQMNKDDLSGLLKAGQLGYLLNVKNLALTGNKLTGRVEELLSVFGVGMEYLNLFDTALDESDTRSLCEAVNDKRFKRLRWLVLEWNNLSGCIGDLLCGSDDCVLPCLEYLSFNNTSLNSTDLENLSQAVACDKLPGLTDLHLKSNNLCTMEDQVENLIRTCIQFHKQSICLFLNRNDLSEEFLQRMGSLCAGTNTELGETTWAK